MGAACDSQRAFSGRGTAQGSRRGFGRHGPDEAAGHDVLPKPHNEDAGPRLRDLEVNGVQRAEEDLVLLALRLHELQALDDQAKEILVLPTAQAKHVLKEVGFGSLRLNQLQSADEGPGTVVVHATPSAGLAERLAGRSSYQNVMVWKLALQIHVANVLEENIGLEVLLDDVS